jgi:hypothetical protein
MSAATPQRVALTWQLPATQGFDGGVGQLIIDATINEQHAIAAEVTTQPVETGSDIADHIRTLPQRLTLEGMMSNSPIGGVSSYMNGVTGSVKTFQRTVGRASISYQAFTFDGNVERVKVVYGDIINAMQSAAIFSVTTTLATYENLAAVNFNVPRNVRLGNVLRFTIDFQMIRFVTTQTVAALPGRTQKHRGARTGKPATDQQAKKIRSTLKHVGLSRLLEVGD